MSKDEEKKKKKKKKKRQGKDAPATEGKRARWNREHGYGQHQPARGEDNGQTSITGDGPYGHLRRT